jgi:hypothetical protein
MAKGHCFCWCDVVDAKKSRSRLSNVFQEFDSNPTCCGSSQPFKWSCTLLIGGFNQVQKEGCHWGSSFHFYGRKQTCHQLMSKHIVWNYRHYCWLFFKLQPNSPNVLWCVDRPLGCSTWPLSHNVPNSAPCSRRLSRKKAGSNTLKHTYLHII